VIRRTLVIALPVYFVWELAQMPGYVPEAQSRGLVVAFRGLATLGDAAMVLALWGFGALVFHGARWFSPPRLRRYGLIIAAGIAVNIAVEWFAVHVLGIWAHQPWQPSLPPLGRGLFAVLQPVVLRPLTFWTAHRLEPGATASSAGRARSSVWACPAGRRKSSFSSRKGRQGGDWAVLGTPSPTVSADRWTTRDRRGWSMRRVRTCGDATTPSPTAPGGP
jgi:hypothetical protein